MGGGTLEAPWFAVDEDGVIARFAPGEYGKTPERARASGRRERLDEAIDIARLLRIVDEDAERFEDDPIRPSALDPGRYLVILRAHDAEPKTAYRDNAGAPRRTPRALDAFSPRVLRDDSPLVFITEQHLSASAILELAKDPEVHHLIDLRDVASLLLEARDLDPLVRFVHDDESGEHYEYHRVRRVIERPLHATEIPLPERTALLALRVPHSLQTADVIHVRGLVADALPEADDAPEPLGVTPVPRARPSWGQFLLMFLGFVAVSRILMFVIHVLLQ